MHGQTPYQALLGRTPPLLKEFEAPAVSQVADELGGDNSRHVVRLRELAVQHMIEGTARARA